MRLQLDEKDGRADDVTSHLEI